MQKIVVGIDGSEGAQHALRWALEEARRTDTPLEVVHAWGPAPMAAGLYSGAVFDETKLEETADRVIDASLDGEDILGVTIERSTVRGTAAQALLDAAKGADLVCVGSRGLGGFASLLLGSVSSQVSHYAPCPVVIVPAA